MILSQNYECLKLFKGIWEYIFTCIAIIELELQNIVAWKALSKYKHNLWLIMCKINTSKTSNL